MSKDSDPRFQNSKFLSFLKKVQTGEFELTEDNRLIEHPEKSHLTQELDQKLKLDAMDSSWGDAIQQEARNEATMSMMDTQFVAAHNKVIVEDAKLDEMEEIHENATKELEEDLKMRAEKKAKELQQMWEDMARNYDPNNPELMDKLQSQWEKAFEEWDESKLSEHWDVA